MKSAIVSFVTIIFFILIFAGCSSSEIGNSRDVNPATVYQQYSLSYTAGEPSFECLAQFRFAGEDGTTLVLSEPSFISFDDKIIKVDSNDFAGAYYGARGPAANFFGKHQFSFTSTDLKTYSNSFTIDSVAVKGIPVAVSKSEPLRIEFDGLTAGSEYSIEAATSDTDSSFTVSCASPGNKAFLEIPALELMRQKGNSITLNFSVVQKIPLQNVTPEGGVISIMYDLKPVKLHLQEAVPFSFSGNNNRGNYLR